MTKLNLKPTDALGASPKEFEVEGLENAIKESDMHLFIDLGDFEFEVGNIKLNKFDNGELYQKLLKTNKIIVLQNLKPIGSLAFMLYAICQSKVLDNSTGYGKIIRLYVHSLQEDGSTDYGSHMALYDDGYIDYYES